MESPGGVAALYSSSTGGGADGTFAKRKRTKRLRSLSSSPPPLAPPPPPREDQDYSSSTTTATEEEEDTAHCLILLAQGRALGEVDSRKLAETTPAAAAAAAKLAAGFYAVYECKTCNRRFPSFQALGGHRTSHKKPRPAAAASPDRVDGPETTSTSSSAGLAVVVPAADVGSKSRPHECSICGSEFASGQALGGHMRRHRPPQGPTAAPSSSTPKEKRVLLLSLDLNLPAPSEESISHSNSSMAIAAFAAIADQRPMARPLVDCHY